MDLWYEKIENLKAYNPEKNQAPDYIVISEKENLSPLTNFFLNTFINTINDNIIFAIPDTILRPIPIIAYMYANNLKKSVLIFSQKADHCSSKNPIDIHYKNYYLLSTIYYLFLNIPIGIMSENSVDAKLYLPRGSRQFKKKYAKQLNEILLKEDNPKILLSSDENDNRITDVIEDINTDELTQMHFEEKIDIGMVIFENTDRFVYSDYSLNHFLEWVQRLIDKKVKILFHFSNPNSKYIDIIKEKTNSFALVFGPTLLRHNESLKNASMHYFGKELSKNEWSIISRYNVDNNNFYRYITDISITQPLCSGNIDYHYAKIKSINERIDENSLVNKRQYYTIIDLSLRIFNLSINPSLYKQKFFDPIKGWQYYSIPFLLKRYLDLISDESSTNYELLSDLVSELLCIYYELKECKRYGEKESYSRIAKDYEMISLTNQELNSIDNYHMIIATYTAIERNILKGEIDKKLTSDSIEIEYIDRLVKKSDDRSNTILFLPGPLRLKNISELMRPYHKIIILSYQGNNNNIVKSQIELFNILSDSSNEKPLAYLKQLYEHLHIRKDGLFKDYSKKAIKEEPHKHGIINETDNNTSTDILSKISSIVALPKFTNLKIMENELGHIEQKITEIEHDTELEDSTSANSMVLTLLKIDDNSIVNKKFFVDNTYLYLKNLEADIEELFPMEFKTGSYVILLDNNEKKTMLDTILEIFNLEDSVDKHLINLWKKSIMKFIEEKRISYSEFYKRYKENGGDKEYQTVRSWSKGYMIGPQSKNDLRIIGKITDNDEILDNYEIIFEEMEYLRNIHRLTGRRIKKVIKEIIKGNINKSNLSYEESLLYDQIKNGIYKITE
jgi:hypothetical protein